MRPQHASLAALTLGALLSLGPIGPAAPVALAGGAGAEESPEQARVRESRTRTLIAEAASAFAEFYTPATKSVLQKLDQPIALNFPNETPLEDVLKYLRDATKEKDGNPSLPIYVDPLGLQEAEKTLASPVTINLDGVPLKTSLRLLLKQLDLAYCVVDGLLFISTPDKVLDELREFESAHVAADKRILPPSLSGPGMMMGGQGGMGGGFR